MINTILPQFPIDIVYLWVDGSDQEWIREKEYWAQTLGTAKNDPYTNKARFVDHNELKYSLRSVAYNLPWVKRVIIVTNGQIPSFINRYHPNVLIVNHSEIMPADSLPTFNSDAIEANIHNIPTLSNHFLYANDDFFVRRPATPLFFFTVFGLPRIRIGIHDMRRVNWHKNSYRENIMYSSKLIYKHFGKHYYFEPSHNLISYRKQDYKEAVEMFQTYYTKTTHAKFRKLRVPQRTLVVYYALMQKHAHIVQPNKGEKASTLYLLLDSALQMRQRIEKANPTLFCINDQPYVKEHNRRKLEHFLRQLYPWPSRWELQNRQTPMALI